MKYQIYVDVLLFVNFIMDYIVINIVRKILKKNRNLLREILGSLVGAMAAVVVYIFPKSFIDINNIYLYMIINALVVLVGFRLSTWREFLKEYILMFVITLVLGGIMNFMY